MNYILLQPITGCSHYSFTDELYSATANHRVLTLQLYRWTIFCYSQSQGAHTTALQMNYILLQPITECSHYSFTDELYSATANHRVLTLQLYRWTIFCYSQSQSAHTTALQMNYILLQPITECSHYSFTDELYSATANHRVLTLQLYRWTIFCYSQSQGAHTTALQMNYILLQPITECSHYSFTDELYSATANHRVLTLQLYRWTIFCYSQSQSAHTTALQMNYILLQPITECSHYSFTEELYSATSNHRVLTLQLYRWTIFCYSQSQSAHTTALQMNYILLQPITECSHYSFTDELYILLQPITECSHYSFTDELYSATANHKVLTLQLYRWTIFCYSQSQSAHTTALYIEISKVNFVNLG